MKACAALAVGIAIVAAAVATAGDASAQTFSYTPPGQLVPANAGNGLAESRALAETMRFPIESAPAYANSQVWGHGGYLLGRGAECDKENFSYPWHDNYCEKRDWEMPLCPGGTGHQGQDIRAASCKNLAHWSVATVDGTIISASGPGTGVAGYQVLLVGVDGTRYRYLHMGNVVVKTGQKVKQGERLGMVSREFNGTPTTVHLHFDLMQNVAPHGMVFVSPYMSLVRSYERLLGIADAGAGGTGDAGASASAADAATPVKKPASADAGSDEDEGLEVEASGRVSLDGESEGCAMAPENGTSSTNGATSWAFLVALGILFRRGKDRFSGIRWPRARR